MNLFEELKKYKLNFLLFDIYNYLYDPLFFEENSWFSLEKWEKNRTLLRSDRLLISQQLLRKILKRKKLI
jgi:hypothetical protein